MYNLITYTVFCTLNQTQQLNFINIKQPQSDNKPANKFIKFQQQIPVRRSNSYYMRWSVMVINHYLRNKIRLKLLSNNTWCYVYKYKSEWSFRKYVSLNRVKPVKNDIITIIIIIIIDFSSSILIKENLPLTYTPFLSSSIKKLKKK